MVNNILITIFGLVMVFSFLEAWQEEIKNWIKRRLK